VTLKQATGPAAFLALFAKGECEKLGHKNCGQRLCPCDDARRWLASLLDTMTFADIWAACDRNDWLMWLTNKYGLSGGGTTDETREQVPWERMASALANPPANTKCEYCDESFPVDELSYGYCEECASDHYVYCAVCDEMHSRDCNCPCGHLHWSDAVGDFVGTGAGIEDHGIAESFDALLVKLGLVLAHKLLIELDRGEFGTRRIGSDFGDCGPRLDELWDEHRKKDDAPFEAGLLWLDTLRPSQHEYTAMVTTWTREHIARREQAIAADKSPRRLIVDGDGRVYVNGRWSAIRTQEARMPRRRAFKLRRRIESAYPGVELRLVHVLKRAPKWKKAER
jgi:hypothetical protein